MSAVIDLKPFFQKWEKLRLWYNLVLLVVLLISHVPRMGHEFFAPMSLLIWLVGAVIANICFLAGALAEGYLSWLGVRSRLMMPLLFAWGVLISIPLVVYYFPFARLYPGGA